MCLFIEFCVVAFKIIFDFYEKYFAPRKKIKIISKIQNSNILSYTTFLVFIREEKISK